MLYVMAEWISSQDAVMEVSLIIGMTVRLAMRMGLHRDPATFPITLFQVSFSDFCSQLTAH